MQMKTWKIRHELMAGWANCLSLLRVSSTHLHNQDTHRPRFVIIDIDLLLAESASFSCLNEQWAILIARARCQIDAIGAPGARLDFQSAKSRPFLIRSSRIWHSNEADNVFNKVLFLKKPQKNIIKWETTSEKPAARRGSCPAWESDEANFRHFGRNLKPISSMIQLKKSGKKRQHGQENHFLNKVLFLKI